MIWKLSADQFRERLFGIVSRKQHWSTPYFDGSTATKAQLNIHFRQEYAVYIRDFSVLLGRLLGRNPPWKIRRQLATTIYEEETGGLSLGKPHQELFPDSGCESLGQQTQFRLLHSTRCIPAEAGSRGVPVPAKSHAMPRSIAEL